MRRYFTNFKDRKQPRKPITHALHNKLKLLVSNLHPHQHAVQQLQRFNKLLIKANEHSYKCIQQVFEMPLNSFIRYMKIVGCRVRQKQQQSMIISITPPSKEQFDHLLNDEISLQMNFNLNQQQILNSQKQAKFKSQHLKELYLNCRQNSLIEQETMLRIMMLMQARQNNMQSDQEQLDRQEDQILDMITEIRDNLSDSELSILECIGFLKNKLEVYQNYVHSKEMDNEQDGHRSQDNLEAYQQEQPIKRSEIQMPKQEDSSQ